MCLELLDEVSFLLQLVAQLVGAVEYTDSFSADGLDLPPLTRDLVMTRNNLIVRL